MHAVVAPAPVICHWLPRALSVQHRGAPEIFVVLSIWQPSARAPARVAVPRDATLFALLVNFKDDEGGEDEEIIYAV